MIKRLAILLDPAPAATAPAGGGSAAPAAPAAAPAAPAAPAADKAPAAPAAGGEPNPFDKLDDMIATSRGKEPAKPEDKKPDDKPTDKKPEDKPDPKATDDKRKIESGPKALREQLEKTNGELKTFREKTTQLEAKIKEYEDRGKDTTALAERLKTIETEKDAALAELRMLKREASPEFTEKYEKPFKRAADTAEKIVLQLNTAPGEAADGTPIEGRKATWDDFVRIFNMPYGQAQEEAERMFGKSERVVMSHYDRLHSLQEERNAALQEERTQWKAKEEKEKADQAVQAQNREKHVAEIQNTWKRVNQELVEKHPDLYAPKPDDAEEAKLVTEAHGLFDAKPQTWQQQVAKDAHIRQKLAGFYLAQKRLSKANDRIAELESALEEAKSSRPGAVRRPGGTEKPADESWDSDLRKTLAG